MHDETYKVGKNQGYARISLGKIGDKFNLHDEVIVLKKSEHSNQLKKIDAYIDKINQLEHEKDNNSSDAVIRELENKIDEYENKLTDKHATISKLESRIHELEDNIATYKNIITNKESEITNLKNRIDEIGAKNDELTKKIDNSIPKDEHAELENQLTFLNDELHTNENKLKYWQNSYENILDSSDALANKNESLISENEKLRNDNNAINETNKLLNENILGLKTTFEQVMQDKTVDSKNKQDELKETIKKQQSHIDELTDKYQSLLKIQSNIPVNEHYDAIDKLKNKLADANNTIKQSNNELESKLAKQQSELTIGFTNEKAQLLVAYNNELNNLKIKYNNLANSYNNILDELDSITRLNVILDSRHKKIKKNKEHVDLVETTSEQLPPSDESTIEYVPKHQDLFNL